MRNDFRGLFLLGGVFFSGMSAEFWEFLSPAVGGVCVSVTGEGGAWLSITGPGGGATSSPLSFTITDSDWLSLSTAVFFLSLMRATEFLASLSRHQRPSRCSWPTAAANRLPSRENWRPFTKPVWNRTEIWHSNPFNTKSQQSFNIQQRNLSWDHCYETCLERPQFSNTKRNTIQRTSPETTWLNRGHIFLAGGFVF